MNMVVSILVPTAGPVPAKMNAERIVDIAKRFDARVVVVHISDQGESTEGGELALEHFGKAAKKAGVDLETVQVVGEISSMIIEQAKYHEADLILMGATEGRGVARWIMDKVMSNVDTPILILPWTMKKE